MSGRAPPTFSVLIGLVGTVERERILETLAALRAQRGAPTWETILADRRNDEVSDRIRREFPEAHLLPCEAATPLPELRARALDRARGRWIVVTEDHCVPGPDWLACIASAFAEAPPGTAAVGGCVENGVRDTPFHHATFLCEYASLLPPVAEGVVGDLPGMNVAYTRTALASIEPHLLRESFWETAVHQRFRDDGLRLVSRNAIVVVHSKRFNFPLFARQRYLYSRNYAGRRFHRRARFRRFAACAGSAVLPVVLLARIVRSVRAKRDDLPLVAAMPWLAVFVLIWAWGEAVGYAFGPGNALAQIE